MKEHNLSSDFLLSTPPPHLSLCTPPLPVAPDSSPNWILSHPSTKAP